jgi:hypothetical protein
LLLIPWLRRLVAGFPPRRYGFESGSGRMGFVVDKVALGKVSSGYFDFLCQFAFHRLLHNHHHHHLSSGASTIGQTVADVASGLSLTPWEKKANKCSRPILENSLVFIWEHFNSSTYKKSWVFLLALNLQYTELYQRTVSLIIAC